MGRHEDEDKDKDKGKRKRKRSEGEEYSKPHKKVNIQAAPSSHSRNQPTTPTPEASQPEVIRITSVQPAKSCPPALVTAPGIRLPDGIEFQAYTKLEPAAAARRGKNSAPIMPTDFMIHSSAHKTLDFTGKPDGPGGIESHLRHYVGVFDPKTGELSVVEAAKLVVRGAVRAQKPPADSAASQSAVTSRAQQRSDLGEAFGTNKAKKALAALAQNSVRAAKTDSWAPDKLDATQQALMDSMKDATRNMATKEELQAAVDQAKPVPPRNLDATEIQDVYKPELLIGADVLNSIPVKDWQESVKNKVELLLKYSFTAHRLADIADGPNPIPKLRTLRYLHWLITILRECKDGKDRGTKMLPPRDKLTTMLHPAPAPVIDSIRRKFTEGGRLRKFHLDLLKTYCMALAAGLSNFEFDAAKLRESMDMNEQQFSQYFREIGGKVIRAAGAVKGKTYQKAKLALPLEFPKVRVYRTRGR